MSGRSRVARLVAAAAALLLLPHPVVADEQAEGSGEPRGGSPVNRELHRTGKRLGEVEAVLRDARADAGRWRRPWPRPTGRWPGPGRGWPRPRPSWTGPGGGGPRP